MTSAPNALPEPSDLVAAWRAGDAAARAALVAEWAGSIDEGYAQKLKGQADHALRNDLRECLDIADLLLALGDTNGVGPIRAVGLLARANGVGIGRGDYAAAIPDYETAANIYLSLERPVDAARSRIGQVYALAVEQRYEQAVTLGQISSNTLRESGQDLALARLLVNTGAAHSRKGDELASLECLTEARQLYLKQGDAARASLARVEYNRGIVLRNLGRFSESISAAQFAESLAIAEENAVDISHARECLAVTYSVMGRFNDALLLFEQTLQVLVNGGRQRDAALVGLSVSGCLLKLGRLADSLDRAREARIAFEALGGRIEIGQALLFEAQVLDMLGRAPEAEQAITHACVEFEAENSSVWLAQAELARASLLGRYGDFETSIRLALRAAETFANQNQPQHTALARLIAARAALRLDQTAQAREHALYALESGQALGASDLVQPAFQILGEIERRAGHLEVALETFEKSMLELERVRSQMMIEDRSFFLRNKLSVYEDAVDASLANGQPARGLHYAERAKSRALLDMLDQRVSVRFEALTPEDRPLVDELLALRSHRDETVRRWQGEQAQLLRDVQLAAPDTVRLELANIEKRITSLWRQLLMRNASYAHEADLWQVPNEDVLPLLPGNSILLEYFVVHNELVVFVARDDTITARRLGISVEELSALIRPWQLNLAACQDAASRRKPVAAALIRNAQVALARLYDALIAPVSQELEEDRELIVVPHGPLHYLPFAALFDGRSYLAERFTLRLLPSAGLLRHVSPLTVDPIGGSSIPSEFLTVGYTSNNQLPAALSEATSIAALLGGTALVEERATAAALIEWAPRLRALHMATHAEFRADNPLFSGLALADGWLTTLDLFNWRLNASLVTLSACQTGRSVIGGGDEILGLLRALLYAGARSVVASLWPVQDVVTAHLMERFYTALAAGEHKGAALRQAQIELRRAGSEHPYFWAPFFLVGDAGPL